MQPSHEIVCRDVPTGSKLELWYEGAEVARVFIHRLQMRAGAAVLRVAGIGDALNDEPYRRRDWRWADIHRKMCSRDSTRNPIRAPLN